MMRCKHDWVIIIDKVEEGAAITHTRKAIWEECEMCNRRRLSRVRPAAIERQEEPGSLFD